MYKRQVVRYSRKAVSRRGRCCQSSTVPCIWKDAAAEVMTKFFEGIYTEWNLLKPGEKVWVDEPEGFYDMPEAKRPGRRSGMTKKEQRETVSLEMTAACTMYALCKQDLQDTKESFGLSDVAYASMLKELMELRSIGEDENGKAGAVERKLSLIHI